LAITPSFVVSIALSASFIVYLLDLVYLLTYLIAYSLFCFMCLVIIGQIRNCFTWQTQYI